MSDTPTRILALDVITKGFGYVVFELPFHLVSFNVAFIEGDKRTGALARLAKLLDRVRPNVLLLEDAEAPGSRRRPRVRQLLEDLARLAREHGVIVQTVPRTAVIARFAPEGERISKQAIAAQLVRFFPEIASQLPPRRRIWESEDHRTGMIDALALAVTYATK
jgi:endonuclease/exonuclease/phosphatase family metal-dependent hydrolase